MTCCVAVVTAASRPLLPKEGVIQWTMLISDKSYRSFLHGVSSRRCAPSRKSSHTRASNTQNDCASLCGCGYQHSIHRINQLDVCSFCHRHTYLCPDSAESTGSYDINYSYRSFVLYVIQPNRNSVQRRRLNSLQTKKDRISIHSPTYH